MGNEPSNDLFCSPLAQVAKDLLSAPRHLSRAGQALEEKPTILPSLATFQSMQKLSFQTPDGVKDKPFTYRGYDRSWGRLCTANFLRAAHLGTPEEAQAWGHFHLSAPRKNTDNPTVQHLHSSLSFPHCPDSFTTAFADSEFRLYGHKQEIMCVMVLLK